MEGVSQTKGGAAAASTGAQNNDDEDNFGPAASVNREDEESKDDTKGKFKCKICIASFNSKKQLEKHRKSKTHKLKESEQNDIEAEYLKPAAASVPVQNGNVSEKVLKDTL